MKINRLFLVLSICTMALLACKKEKMEQPELAEFNENCSCAKEVNADFLMEEKTTANPNFVKYTNTDTIFKNKNVRFTGSGGSTDYTWYIGAEIIHEKTFSRFFSDALVGQDIPISLVIKHTPNKICLPNDDGYDSITKILHVSEFPVVVGDEVYLGTIEGTYRVKSEHLPDSFDIEVDVAKGTIGVERVNFTNYNGEGANCFNQAISDGGNYRQIWFKGGTSLTQCDYLEGSVHNRLDGIVEFDLSFRVFVDGGPEQLEYERTYLGRKL